MRPYGRSLRLSVGVLILVVGALIGSGVAEAFSSTIPLLARSAQAGFDLRELTLAGVLDLGLRVSVKVNLGTAVGLVLAAWLLRRL